MNNNSSPMESLAAFAIVFFAGVIATGGLGAYISHIKAVKDKNKHVQS